MKRRYIAGVIVVAGIASVGIVLALRTVTLMSGGPLQADYDDIGVIVLGACDRPPGARVSFGDLIDNGDNDHPITIEDVELRTEGLEILEVVRVPPRSAVGVLDGFPPRGLPWNEAQIRPLIGTIIEPDTYELIVIGVQLTEPYGRAYDMTVRYTSNGRAYEAVSPNSYEITPECDDDLSGEPATSTPSTTGPRPSGR